MAINSDFRSAGLLSSTFVNTKCFHILGIVFVSSVNEVLKSCVAFRGCLSGTQMTLLGISDGDVSQTPPDSSNPERCSTVGLSTAVASLEQSERDDFRSVCHQPLCCNPSVALMGSLLNQLEKQVPDFTLNQAPT